MAGVSSQGLIISYGDGATPTEGFTAIGNITDHEGPSRENPEVDVTTLSSTAKEFISGLVDNGELSVNVNFDPGSTSHDALLSDQESRTVRNYQITWPVDPEVTWTFPAYVKSFSTRSGVDAPLTGSVTLRVTGAITREEATTA